MEEETEVFKAKAAAWEAHIQPLVGEIIGLADEHGIALLVVGIVTDNDELEGSILTRGGIMALGLRDVLFLQRGVSNLVRDALEG